jgi:hypothetical protein
VRLRLFQLESQSDINDMELCLHPDNVEKDALTLEFALATDEGL